MLFRSLVLHAIAAVGLGTGLAVPLAANPGTFTNPLYDGADPWVIQADGGYWSCWSAGRYLFVGRSDSLLDRGEERAVWAAPVRKAWNTADLWAPELWNLGNKWYLYYAADAGSNETHRMGVLEADSPWGPYTDLGMLETGGRWAIDGTILSLGGKLYFLWSGWPGAVDDQQNLYIAPLESPTKVAGDPILLSEPTLEWERNAMPIQEGPEVLRHGDRTFVVYSASGSWTTDYCLGALWLADGADPLVTGNWTKLPQPVFRAEGTVYGPGHASFTTSPDGTEEWMVYHAKKSTAPGWDREVRAQKIGWTEDSFPAFGSPVAAGTRLPRPSGE